MSKVANKKHIVKKDETMTHIAQEHYGKASLWKGLVHANQWLFDQGRVDVTKDHVLIKVGEEITLLSQDSIEALNKVPLGEHSDTGI